MIDVPQSTIEKPLTAVDYCAAIELCTSIDEVRTFCRGVPEEVRGDERFNKAVAKRLAAINEKGKP